MSDLCISCNELLPEDGSFAKCAECDDCYHFDSCSDASKGKGEGSKKTWKCESCSTSKTRSGKSRTKRDADVGKTLQEINKKLSELMTVKENVDSLMTMKEKVDTLMTVKTTVDSIESSVQMMSDNYDEVLKEMKQQSKDIADLKRRVVKIETDNDSQEVQKLKQEVNRLEQYNRRHNLEIHGLPRSDNEDLLCNINGLAKHLKLQELSEGDVDGIHRLPAKDGKIPAVLVRFVSRMTRDHWLKQRGYLRETKSDVRLFDNLTAQNKRLLWMMRSKAEEKHYQFAWQKDGRMYVRKKQGERAIKIECEQDLDMIV